MAKSQVETSQTETQLEAKVQQVDLLPFNK